MRNLLLAVLLMAAMAGPVSADGMLIIRPMPDLPPMPRVDVKYHHVDVEINDPVAITKVDQVFVNPYHRELEADYIFPIPENASVGRFTAWLGGHKMEAELLDANQARKIYEDIVRRRKDPALLEYAGRGMYRLRVYPVPARGEVRIKIEYQQTLKADNGTVDYLYPLNTEKHSGSKLEECRINVTVNSFEDIGALYCPTHLITTERINEKSLKAVYFEKDIRPDKDFILHFTRQKTDYGFHLLTYREPGESDGYFLGLISPPVRTDIKKVNKNIIFLLDSSGSMRGEKMEQAKEAMKFCLLGLNDGDYFNIIDYDETIKPYQSGIIGANRENIDLALKFAERIEAAGGTNIYDALESACRFIPTDDKPTYIIFLTDGLPTVGNTDIKQIIDNTSRLNEGRARLFVFGVGYDVNAHLLDRLTEGNRGVAEYVAPNENIEVKVSRLASKISHPALTDLVLAFNPKEVHDVYPRLLPDLFYGSEIIVLGRYDDSGTSNAVLKGKVGRQEVVYEYPVRFDDGSSQDEYIAMLWANRRIGYLLQQMRLHGTSDELLNEVVELSKKFGIITEYTSYLVTGDENRRHDDFWYMPAPEVSKRLKKSMDSLGEQETGRSAFNQSKNLGTQNRAAQVPQAGEVMIGDQKKRFSNIAQVGNQAFFQSGTNWVQSNLKEDRFDIEIKPFSKAYFQLLEKDPSLGRYLALGSEVRFNIGSQIVQIADTGKESLSVDELRQLFPN
ncbi:MAG: VIT domain-containing protein [candidate division Zixibacteria bacterium]